MPVGHGSSFCESQSGISSILSGLGISQHPRSSSSSGQKRKRHGETSSTQAKRSRSESSRRRLDITGLIKEEDDRFEEAVRHSIEQPNATSLMGLTRPNDVSFDNRILSCLVISPPGRPIREFNSVKEFLEACRDIIRALRSLYQDGNILHRDISENNIIITDAKKEGEPRVMLIDLDLPKELGSGPSGARHRTDPMEFMAIEVLEGTAHTYRHDLETADIKRGHMDRKRFRGIFDEFPKFDSLKELAEELRRTLFPIREGPLFTGTYRDPEKLYKPMIDAFSRTIGKHTEGESDEKV